MVCAIKNIFKTQQGLTIAMDFTQPKDRHDLFMLFQSCVLKDGNMSFYPQPMTSEQFATHWLEKKSVVVLARTPDQELVGSYWLAPKGVGKLANIGTCGHLVAHDMRGGGIGRMLVAHSLDLALQWGFKALMVDFINVNSHAKTMYESGGFKVIGRIPKSFLQQQGVFMWRSIGG